MSIIIVGLHLTSTVISYENHVVACEKLNLCDSPSVEQFFPLRFIHSHSNATGVFRNAFLEIGALTTSGNCVRHIVSSQDDAVAGLLGQ